MEDILVKNTALTTWEWRWSFYYWILVQLSYSCIVSRTFASPTIPRRDLLCWLTKCPACGIESTANWPQFMSLLALSKSNITHGQTARTHYSLPAFLTPCQVFHIIFPSSGNFLLLFPRMSSRVQQPVTHSKTIIWQRSIGSGGNLEFAYFQLLAKQSRKLILKIPPTEVANLALKPPVAEAHTRRTHANPLTSLTDPKSPSRISTASRASRPPPQSLHQPRIWNSSYSLNTPASVEHPWHHDY